MNTPTHLAFGAELAAALRQRPRSVAPKWFYDAAGSALFDRICELPEYYPTRTEIALLRRIAPELADRMGPEAEIVEFGAGSSLKVELLLDAAHAPAGFVPVDISGEHLASAAARLQRARPGLAVRPVVADFTQGLVLPAPLGQRLGFYPGSSIGNFDPPDAVALLRRMAGWLQGGALLIGVDLIKDPSLLHAAYNDAAGVTAAFNLNLWARANRELQAGFALDQWWHAALYAPQAQRIEMHLVSRRAQGVRIAGEHFEFAAGEAVHTESSYKYTVEGLQALARQAGWQPRAVWTDPQQWFSLHWLQAAGQGPAQQQGDPA